MKNWIPKKGNSYKNVIIRDIIYLMFSNLFFPSCVPDFGKSDLIVLDPPWQNKSAKRLRQ